MAIVKLLGYMPVYGAFMNVLANKKSLKLSLKVHQCRFENLPLYLSSYENNMLKISYQNTFYILRYEHLRYVKSLFTNIQKQYNMLKISLLFKKFTNFTGKQLEKS